MKKLIILFVFLPNLVLAQWDSSPSVGLKLSSGEINQIGSNYFEASSNFGNTSGLTNHLVHYTNAATASGILIHNDAAGPASFKLYGTNGGSISSSFEFAITQTNNGTGRIRQGQGTNNPMYIEHGDTEDIIFQTAGTTDRFIIHGDKAEIEQITTLASYDSLSTHREVSELADTGEISIATGVAGWGQVMIGDNQEWAHFRFTSAGVVTLINNSTNVTTTNDTDGNLNIYDGGTGIVIENQLGSTLKTAIFINYYTL